MIGLEYFSMAWRAMMAKKGRAFLSMLGVIIGVSTVIVVVGIGQGVQDQINAQFKNLSVESIMVRAGGFGGGWGGGGGGSSSKLSHDDIDYVLDRAQYVRDGVATLQGSTTATYGKESASASVLGIESGYFDMSGLSLEYGRDFSAEEYSGDSRVAVLGYDVPASLAPDAASGSLVGQSVSIDGRQYLVVGILAENGSASRMVSYDEAVYVPYATAETRLLGKETTPTITFRAKDSDSVSAAMEEITELLRESHKLSLTADNDFSTFDAGSIVSSAQSTAKLLQYLLISMASIVLLVSGIGIMNVMFVTVAERTKEIGVLKAVGARQENILIQFLLEATLLSVVGGLIGIACGWAAIPALNLIPIWTLALSPQGALIAFSFSVGVGVLFGFYPAFKASRLDPVDALRSE